jgi:Uma2 family endonuclease
MTTLSARGKTRAYPDIRRMNLTELYELAERLHGGPVPGMRMSEQEFLAWCDEDLRAEWVDGKVILMSPVSDTHDDLHTWLIALIRSYIEEEDLGTIRQNMFVRLAEQHVLRVPDLMFISKTRLNIINPTYLDGPPDLIMEIISPDSQSRDRREKYEEYEKAGVREYWIIDPLSKTLEASRLRAKKFEPLPEKQGIIRSAAIRGFGLKIEWLWQKPLPKVSAALRFMKTKA